jgi:hypothetical protein
MSDERMIIGFTFRVSVEDCGISPAALREVVQRHVDDWNDGRRPLSVEVALDSCERIVRTYATLLETPRAEPPPAVNALDNDTTVSIEPFPTFKTGDYRVLCTSSRSEGGRDGYELASRATFATFEEAEQYADGISSSRTPVIVLEVERASL